MIPILYSSLTEGTVPSHNGIGPLTDSISCKVTEERNGSYELVMEYHQAGVNASYIEPNAFIKAKPNPTDPAQLFRIYKVGKAMNGKISVYAQHISYDLSGKLISSGTAASLSAAITLLNGKAGNFTISTNKTSNNPFKITEPSSVRSWFGGKAGSLLDIYGGEWYFNNYAAELKANRGADHGAQIRYAKNLTELSQELNIENLCTGVLPYYVDQDGNVTAGTKVSTGLVLDVAKDIAIDFTQDVDPESGTAIATQLATLANNYIANNQMTTVFDSVTLDFVQLDAYEEIISLCDTISIYFSALGINTSTKVVKTEWNVLEDRYEHITLGNIRSSFADTFVEVQQAVNSAADRDFMDRAIVHATELITGNLGGYVILHDSNADGYPDEILVMDTADITTAVKVWRWNKNGLGYSGSGYAGPFSTLALTADGKIVADAITSGTLNADIIKAGTISDLNNKFSINMTAGTTVLDQMKSKTSISVTEPDLAPRCFIGYDANDGELFQAIHSNGQAIATMNGQADGYGHISVGDSLGNQLGTLWCTSVGGHLSLKEVTQNTGSSVSIRNQHDTAIISFYSTAAGGTFYINDRSSFVPLFIARVDGNGAFVNVGDKLHPYAVNLRSTSDGGMIEVNNGTRVVGYLDANSAGGGTLALKNSSGTVTITCSGDTGNITCVSLTQTSSRKVKKNVKPIKDARKILELEAVQFDYKNEAQGKNKRGFIAEDVAEVLPNLVTKETEERPATLDYMQMIPYLQAVIKEQDERIKALEDKLSKLGG